MMTFMDLPKRRLVEGAQLARMQGILPLAQEVERLQSDLEMLRDRAFIEGIGRARQLDLAVQRFVGDAEQGAVGHAQAIAVGGDGAALHVERDGAREIETTALLGV